MVKIREITDTSAKASICDSILRALPDWFGIESSIVDYVMNVQAMPFYAAYDSNTPVGFVALKEHNPYTAEVCVMGILSQYHRQGIGMKLIECCESFCRENKIEFLTIKTLDESRESRSYEKTRMFYFKAGFRPLEVFPLHRDEDNPCLLMAKYISSR
jgi:GNAT superfamily N-acetyltransferase